MKFVGFVIAITLATIGFFVLAAVSLIAPVALSGEDDEETDEEEIALD